MAGAVAYGTVLATNGFTFHFERPIWSDLKVRLYLINIAVPLLFALGLGLGVGPVLSPRLTELGLDSSLAGLLPILLAVGLLQILQLWVMIWAPLERRVIARRLAARGITMERLASAVLVGLSDPVKSSFKKFTAIEDDLGALWITPGQLVFYGDAECFSLTREQVTRIERKSDSGNASILSGTAHCHPHVLLPNGEIRQIRFHTEGLWTNV